MEASFRIPFYAKAAMVFISAFALVFTLRVGQEIIVPILYATIIAILLNPLVNYFVKIKLNRIVSISIAVTVAIATVLSVFYLLSSQLSMFSESYPQLKAKFTATSVEFVQWISEKFNIRVSSINTWTQETQSKAIDDFALGESITEAGQVVMVFLLLPVYLFLILYYKPLLLEFVRRLFSNEHQAVLSQILTSTKRIIQTYLVGLFFELIIVAVLNTAALLILGIEYAIMLGIIGALLNLIPYLGGVIAIALPMIIAFVTKDSLTSPLLVMCAYLLIQFVDNNFIVPKFVASRVKINALISIIVVIIGGAIWGISGMFLSIPIIAIVKVVCDHIEVLKPWGFLLGDIVPTTPNFPFLRKMKPVVRA